MLIKENLKKKKLPKARAARNFDGSLVNRDPLGATPWSCKPWVRGTVLVWSVASRAFLPLTLTAALRGQRGDGRAWLPALFLKLCDPDRALLASGTLPPSGPLAAGTIPLFTHLQDQLIHLCLQAFVSQGPPPAGWAPAPALSLLPARSSSGNPILFLYSYWFLAPRSPSQKALICFVVGSSTALSPAPVLRAWSPRGLSSEAGRLCSVRGMALSLEEARARSS